MRACATLIGPRVCDSHRAWCARVSHRPPGDPRHMRETLAPAAAGVCRVQRISLWPDSPRHISLCSRSRTERNSTAIAALSEETAALRQENRALRAQVACVKEETQRRERSFTAELQELREQLQTHTRTPCTDQCTDTDTHSTTLQTTAHPQLTCRLIPMPPLTTVSRPIEPPSIKTNTPLRHPPP